jgi:hypothetical protein
MKIVAKGILKDHLVSVASNTTCSGNLNGFNNAGYKATFHPLKVPVPLTESTLFTLMKCMRTLQRDAILIHWDVWSHHVHGTSMCCLPKPTGEQRRATRRAGRLPGLLVGPGPSGNGPQNFLAHVLVMRGRAT